MSCIRGGWMNFTMLGLLLGIQALGGESLSREKGSGAVQVVRYEWKDTKRDRIVPVKIYLPAHSTNPCPVIVFSHGLGGTREGYEYLGQCWAQHGYLSVHLQHAGSDEAVWRDAKPGGRMQSMRRAAMDPRNALNRVRDVSFALDELGRLNAEPGPLKGRVDLGHVGVAGHSFGANTALLAGGQRMGVRELSLADSRVKAVIAMSSPVPRNKARWDQIYAEIKVPCLHMTGTLDQSLINDTTPAERRIPFDHSTHAEEYLLTFNGGDHMVFSGRGNGPERKASDEKFQKFIKAASVAFWDAYLRGDSKAKAWLDGGGFARSLGGTGTFEVKQPQ